MLFESVYSPIKEIEPDRAGAKTEMMVRTDQQDDLIPRVCGRHLHNKASPTDITWILT